MKFNKEGKLLLQRFEGLASKHKAKNIICNKQDIANNITIYPYKCSANRLTIGWGHVIQDDKTKLSKGITCKKADKIFEEDITIFSKNLYQTCQQDNVELNENQFSALVSFCFNCGNTAYSNSTLRKVVKKNKNNFKEIEKQFLRWCKIGNIENLGLLNRRKDEFKLYSTETSINYDKNNILKSCILYFKELFNDIKEFIFN